MKEELKTLKDIEGGIDEYYVKYYENIRQEAIKWVKEDLNFIKNLSGKKPTKIIVTRWMKRLNITEEELAGEGK